MKTQTLTKTARRILLAAAVATTAILTANAANYDFTGEVDKNWSTKGNWRDETSGAQASSVPNGSNLNFRPSTAVNQVNDDFKNNPVVNINNNYTVNWKLHVRNLGTEAAPVVFKADTDAHGVKVGNTTENNNTGWYIGCDTGDAWLKLEKGTYNTNTKGFWFIGGATYQGHVVAESGVTVASSVDFQLKNGTVEINGANLSSGGDTWVGEAGNGTLTINSGTVTVPSGKWTLLGKNSGKTGTVNLNGGTLTTKHIHKGSGTAVVNFNGGTLKANAAYTDNGGLVGTGVAINVLAGGGTIDCNGNDILILSGWNESPGGMNFVGGNGNTVSIGTNPDARYLRYTGLTSVAPGTRLAVWGLGAAKDVVTNGIVVAGVPAVGDVIFTCTRGDGYTLEDVKNDLKVMCPVAPGTTFGLDDSMTNVVVKSVGTPLDNYWTGNAGDGNLSNPANWANGVPTGNANIFCAGAKTLTKGDGFAPTSITFLEGSAAVTIDGGDFTGITAVTNLSSASHTINAKVYFASGINVKQNAASYTTIDQSHVTFAGGAYAASGKTIDSGYSVAMFGKYYFANTSEWVAAEGGNSRKALGANAELYVPIAGKTTFLYISEGAKLNIGNMTSPNEGANSGRLSYQNFGDMVVTNLVVTGSGNRHVTYDQGTAKSSVFKFNSVTNEMTSNWFYLADANKASKHTFYIGEGGLNYSGNNGVYCFGNDKDGNTETICPWDSNFTIANRGDSGKALVFMRNVEFCTDDESGVGRTITIDAVTRGYNGTSPAITVSGKGALKVNKAAQNDSGVVPTVKVKDSATLEYASGATFGNSAITLDYGTTFSFFNASNDFSTDPAIRLSGNGEGKTTIKVDGRRLKSGTDIELISSGAPVGCAERVTVTGTALGGRKYTLREDNGKLLLNVTPSGLMLIFK